MFMDILVPVRLVNDSLPQSSKSNPDVLTKQISRPEMLRVPSIENPSSPRKKSLWYKQGALVTWGKGEIGKREPNVW